MPTQLKNKIVKTRKHHVCWGCGKVFPPKTEMQFITQLEDGYFMDSYWCRTCQVVRKETCERDDSIYRGELRANFPERYESKSSEP